jgi:NAD(P)-dependent dehydrogenase (short-subunit alcohol dehydrogenase family)
LKNVVLQGKTVVVTGANGALGRVTAETARTQGASVVGLDLVQAVGLGEIRVLAVDLTDAQATAACVAKIGDIDAVFNIAGGFDMGPMVHETGDAQWEHMFNMNVVTMRNMVAAVVPTMLDAGRGSIVNVGALSAREGQANMGAYCVAKSAVMRLTESLAKELRHRGVNVNAVLPSIIDTPANRKDMPDADFSRWVQPQDLANVICYLGSDAARAVHGALVPVQGLA